MNTGDNVKEVQQVIGQALMKLKDLVNSNGEDPAELLSTVKLFLLSVMSTAADLIEVSIPGGGAYLYSEIEAGAKMGGLKSIEEALQKGSPHYSISNIDSEDMPTAMNYIGQQLLIVLTKSLHELPKPLRREETQLRGIETLVANFLNQRFNNPHDILDALCEHVHMSLDDLKE